MSQLRRRLLAEAVQRYVPVDDAGSEQALGRVQVAVLRAVTAQWRVTEMEPSHLQPGSEGMLLPGCLNGRPKPQLTMGWSSSCTVCSKTLSIVVGVTDEAKAGERG